MQNYAIPYISWIGHFKALVSGIVYSHYYTHHVKWYVFLCLSGLGLSQDVAGATFMAAGSSAPELVTAFLGNDALVQLLVSALQLEMSMVTRPFSA